MKGLNLFLAACFVVPALNGAMADNAKNTSRIPSTRNQTATSTSRNTGTPKQRTTSTTARTTTTKNIVPRTTQTNIRNRTATVTPRENSVVARSTKIQPTQSRKNIVAPIRTNVRSGLSRAATVQTRESVMQRDFGKCKSVFFDCMDEFCANKDAQLKRCACSARSNEFKATQKNLDNVEDKLLDFSQRLLKVNMDPADAAVINQESEGERAYNETRDKTESRKTLDAIAKKLNTDFDSAETNNMSALSWSLDVDSAFDSVDSLSGVATTAKSGTALRNAALPVCREMAAEVCSNDDISLVENSYNMAIEQDCNTVKKAYETQTAAARSKVLESGALLDMTRLNNYQENNADDILTCKSKMLDMLTNTNVCGDNLTKCLDISGRYINPTTGEAFLSPELVNLSTLITRPTNTDSWAKTPKNSAFVSYLNGKKKYIEPATKNCESIADDVWDIFIEDALAQIKIAQNAKLEEVRQSCTTLLTQCISNANESLSNFDSRALSTFGVITDKTANALCENVKKSCSAIMEYTPDDSVTLAGAEYDWNTGTTQIAARESYEKIINTCREIGRDCIINSCKSISGNFGLCESIHGSVNRHSILTRAACWNEVYNCVAAASDETINTIHTILPHYANAAIHNPHALYEQMYSRDLTKYINNYTSTHGTESTPDRSVYDICRQQSPDLRLNNVCGSNTNAYTDPDNETANCYRCRIAEQIWGNCKLKPDNIAENPILIPDAEIDTTTLLSWFAKNTHTNENQDSCAVSICPAGSIEYTIDTSVRCVKPENVVSCSANNSVYQNILCEQTIQTPLGSGVKNCCPTNTTDTWGNCCINGGTTTSITENIDGLLSTSINSSTINTQSKICTPSSGISSMKLIAKYRATTDGPTTYIFCTGGITGDVGDNAQITCNGQYIMLEVKGNNASYQRYKTATCANENCTHANTTFNYGVNYFITADKSDTANYCPTQDNIQNNVCSMTEALWPADCGVNANTNNNWDGKWLIDLNK